MNLLCPQVLLFLLLSCGHRFLPQGKGFDSECWSWGGTGPGLDLLGLSPAVFAGGFPDWAGLHVCQRCRCCTHLARSALWRCSPLCCRHAGKVHIRFTCITLHILQYTLLYPLFEISKNNMAFWHLFPLKMHLFADPIYMLYKEG